MGEPIKKLQKEAIMSNHFDNREAKEKILDTHTEELVIGLCGPIGSNIHLVANSIVKILT